MAQQNAKKVGDLVPDAPAATAARAALGLGSAALQPATAFAAAGTLAAHVADTANPHAVTRAQVGLGSVDNTSDVAKPISTATQGALDLKAPLAGSASITTLGTITTGTWQGTAIAAAYLGAHAHSGADITSGTVAAARLPALAASGASHAAGLVPDPGATAGTAKFLREDATFAVPSAAIAIGGAVAGGSASKLLYEDASQNLATGPGWDGTTLTTGSSAATRVKLTSSASTATLALTDTAGCGISYLASGFLIIQSPGGGDEIQLQVAGGRPLSLLYRYAGFNTTQPSAAAHVTTDLFSSPLLITQGIASQTGAHYTLRGNSSTTAGRDMAVIDATWATSTDASRKGRLQLYAADSTGTNREGVRVGSDGTQALLSFYGAPEVAKAAAPTTLADVITILRNLGLCS